MVLIDNSWIDYDYTGYIEYPFYRVRITLAATEFDDFSLETMVGTVSNYSLSSIYWWENVGNSNIIVDLSSVTIKSLPVLHVGPDYANASITSGESFINFWSYNGGGIPSFDGGFEFEFSDGLIIAISERNYNYSPSSGTEPQGVTLRLRVDFNSRLYP